jgi:CheY-like chemotaxis protein
LDEALEKANVATEYKSMFLANMSHEIRTPLNGVIMAGNLLINSELNDSQKDAVKIIRDSGKNLLVIVNDILDFSKIEANKLEFDIQPFALRQMIESTLLPFKYECSKKEIELELVFISEPSEVLLGDKQRVRQVLTNLVGNAVKFTDNGGVKIIVESTLLGIDNKARISFSIEDSGIGISNYKLESIFESFTQQDGSTSRKYDGTGLGTSIAKMLVEMMAGEIKAISPNPKNDHNQCAGTVLQFYIDLETSKIPLDQVEQTPNADFIGSAITNQSDSNQTPWSSKTKILLAEDNLINQKVAKMVFERMGLSIEVVENGKEAVRRVGEVDFDLIFMDYMMPEVDGLQATAILRENGNSTPIIAVTANAREQDRIKCMEAGMNDYISKPVSIEKLQLILKKWL